MAVNGEKVSPMDVSDTEGEEVVKSAETTTAEEEDALKEALDSVSVVASSAVSAASTTTVSVGGNGSHPSISSSTAPPGRFSYVSPELLGQLQQFFSSQDFLATKS